MRLKMIQNCRFRLLDLSQISRIPTAILYIFEIRCTLALSIPLNLESGIHGPPGFGPIGFGPWIPAWNSGNFISVPFII